MIYRFDDQTVDTESLELRRAGEPVAVEPLAFRLLVYLIENRDRVVGKVELIQAIWDGRAISDSALNSSINSARRAVGDSGNTQSVIKTFPRRGFRFVADLNGADDAHRQNAAALATDKPSIAVLPFENLSGDPEQDFIGDGLAEDIITALSRVRAFRIIARSSTFRYKGTSPDMRQVAEELGIRYVVEGSVRRAGDRIRVTAQLIDAPSNIQFWAEKYDRNFTEIFAVQDDITQTIIGRLEPELGRAEYHRTRKTPSENLNAWELYHRAVSLFYERNEESNRAARALFQKSIDIDPEFSRAYAGLSLTHVQSAVTGNAETVISDILKAAKRAVQLDDTDYWAHAALGTALQFARDPTGSLRAFETSLELNPNLATTHGWFGEALISAGRVDDAIPHLHLAIRLSPGDPSIGPFYGRLSRAKYFCCEYEEAVHWAEKAFEKAHVWPVRASYCAALAQLGRAQEAKKALKFLNDYQPGITAAFVRAHLPYSHKPYMDHLIEGLRKAGLPE